MSEGIIVGDQLIVLLPNEDTDDFAKAVNDRIRQGLMSVGFSDDIMVLSSGSGTAGTDEQLP
jgi:hypothetical protein